jgi:N-acetylglucosaminylphosphatidylinositol deacetylase
MFYNILTRRIVLRLIPLLLVSLVCHRIFWHLVCAIAPSVPTFLRNRSIVLLIAHPDDESIFFAPTVQALTSPQLLNHVRILCLSTGNSAGLGTVRRKELETAALILGVRHTQDVIVVNDESRFKDDIHHRWNDWEIADLLNSTLAVGQSLSSSTSWRNTDLILTFDSRGISSHPNHISLYYGAQLFLSNLIHDDPTGGLKIDLYTLGTISPIRHYGFVVDIIPTLFSIFSDSWWTRSEIQAGDEKIRLLSGLERAVFIADPNQYLNAQKAMIHGHRSQTVWFRWLWIHFGRYMVVNDLQREETFESVDYVPHQH